MVEFAAITARIHSVEEALKGLKETVKKEVKEDLAAEVAAATAKAAAEAEAEKYKILGVKVTTLVIGAVGAAVLVEGGVWATGTLWHKPRLVDTGMAPVLKK
jgi:hypothetical protein